MFNKYILDSDTFANLNKRKVLRKKLAQQMILDTTFLQVERFILRFIFFCILIYTVSHYMAYGDLFFLHPHVDPG